MHTQKRDTCDTCCCNTTASVRLFFVSFDYSSNVFFCLFYFFLFNASLGLPPLRSQSAGGDGAESPGLLLSPGCLGADHATGDMPACVENSPVGHSCCVLFSSFRVVTTWTWIKANIAADFLHVLAGMSCRRFQFLPAFVFIPGRPFL